MRGLTRAVTLATALALALAACGGATAAPGPATGSTSANGSAPLAASTSSRTPASSAAAVADPCALLTDDEIKATTGFGVTHKESGPEFGIFDEGCHWTLEPGKSGVSSEIVLGVMGPDGKKYFDKYLEPYEGEHVTGVGDSAVWGEADAIDAVEGDVLLAMQYVDYPGDPQMSVKLMRVALSHVSP